MRQIAEAVLVGVAAVAMVLVLGDSWPIWAFLVAGFCAGLIVAVVRDMLR